MRTQEGTKESGLRFKSKNQLARRKALEGILGAEYQEGYLNGIAEGYAVAQRIYYWFAVNEQLAEPHSTETLKEWSQLQLENLKEKLNETDN